VPEPIKILRLPQYFRNLQRLGEIASVLVKHGFGDLVTRLNLLSYLTAGLRVVAPHRWREVPSSAQLSVAARLRLVCEELGPTFIKLGQLIATRPDLFPDSIIREFRRLQDDVPPFPAPLAKGLIAEELGRPLEEVFVSFDEIPLGSASISQVHRATLRTGEEVVVKVQRPNLDRLIDTDTDILLGIATLLEEHVPESKQFNPFRLVEEFSRSFRLERDFNREAHHMERFRSFMGNDDLLIIPQVFHEFSSKRILVQQFIRGHRVDCESSAPHPTLVSLSNRKELLHCLSHVTLKSIFEVGFFHGDPHPGNLLITDDGRLALLDFGRMGRLEGSRRIEVIIFLVSLFRRDLRRALASLQANEVVSSTLDDVALTNQLAEVLDLYLDQSLADLNIANLISDIFEIVRRHGVRPPPDLLLIGQVLTALQYTGLKLDPDFQPFAAIKPYLENQYLRSFTDPHSYGRYIRDVSDEYERVFRELPRHLRDLMRLLPRGQFILNYRMENYAEVSRHQNKLINRIIMTSIGITCIAVGRSFYGDSFTVDAAAYGLMSLGAIILLTAWAAVRRSGGT
jgi:ubiquinone biosynthesis protein